MHCRGLWPTSKSSHSRVREVIFRAASKHLSGGTTITVLLALTTGCFLAPSTLLPSTFAMYCMTAAATGVLTGNVGVRLVS
jgi:hypothetical protein